MVRLNAAPAFDFDEWAALYQQDPQAFEARRKALLTIEVARSGIHASQARVLVDRLEQELDGKSDLERVSLSMLALLSAASQLTSELQTLALALERHSKRREDLERARQLLSAAAKQAPPRPSTE
ncbi:MAG: DUF3135 domain-containing protein [Burkholderiaceae bacterium]